MDDVIITLHNNLMHGQPGSSKTFHKLRARFYSPNMVEKNSKLSTTADVHLNKTVSREQAATTARTNLRHVQRTRKHPPSRFRRRITQIEQLHAHRNSSRRFLAPLVGHPISQT